MIPYMFEGAVKPFEKKNNNPSTLWTPLYINWDVDLPVWID